MRVAQHASNNAQSWHPGNSSHRIVVNEPVWVKRRPILKVQRYARVYRSVPFPASTLTNRERLSSYSTFPKFHETIRRYYIFPSFTVLRIRCMYSFPLSVSLIICLHSTQSTRNEFKPALIERIVHNVMNRITPWITWTLITSEWISFYLYHSITTGRRAVSAIEVIQLSLNLL